MRTPLIVLIGAYAIAIAGFTVIPGVDPEGQPWTMNFLHALYVVSYTGSTIGFGEIPHEFTDAQRMWTIVCIYMTVFAWLYAIGSLIGLARDDAFRAVLKLRQLRRGISHMDEPFYLVCGYGDSGRILVEDLTRRGRRVVVVDLSGDAIRALAMRDHWIHVPGFQFDAAIPDHLLQAGLQSRWCAGLIAATDNDEVNLKITIAGRLLNQKLNVIGCADTEETAGNMASFRTDHVVRGVEEFARRVTLAITRPDTYRLYERLTEAGAPEKWEPDADLKGTWILCGFNAYGQALQDQLAQAGIRVRIIDDEHSEQDLPEDSTRGRSSRAETLERAGVGDATGLVVMHDNDAENLSTIITARMLNPKLLLIARENHAHNRRLFAEAGTHLAASISGIIASAIRPILEAPLALSYIQRILEQDDRRNRECLAQLDELVGDRRLEFWSSRISDRRTPALAQAIEEGTKLRAGDLMRDPRDRDERLAAVLLMIRHEDQDILYPDPERQLAVGDRILFCGTPSAGELMQAVAVDHELLHYLCTGESRSGTWLWRASGSPQPE